jgi:rare lipoprotein A (peptidoglycan hydrolase)
LPDAAKDARTSATGFSRIFISTGTMLRRARLLRMENAVPSFSAIRRLVSTAVVSTLAPSTAAHAEPGIASYYNGRHGRAARALGIIRSGIAMVTIDRL